jgi:hypothetical protein
LVAVVTAVLATIAISQKRALPDPLSQIDAWSFLDVGIFVAIAWGIYKMSRIAAVVGLVAYIAEQIFMRMSNPKMASSGIFVTVLIVMAFINAIRGTFAYHSLPPTNNADVDPEV